MTEVRNRHINQRSNDIFAKMGRVGERSEGMAKRPSGSFGTERAGKPCHRRARQVQEMYGGRWAAGSRQNSAPTSCTWYCACVYRTIGGRGGPGAMRQ